MGSWLYNLLDMLFGQNDMMKSTILKGLAVLKAQFATGGIVTKSMNIFAAIACSLLIMYFFINLVDQASRDMYSIEKLVIAFIKMITAFIILLYLSTIMGSLVNMGSAFYDVLNEKAPELMTATASDVGVQYQVGSDTPVEIADAEKFAGIKDAFIDEYSGWKGFKEHLGLGAISLIPMLIMWLASLATLFLVMSNMIQILIRGVCAPLAVVQLFDEGMRSSGIKYLKKFGALCFTFAVFALINQATVLVGTQLASLMTGTIVNGQIITKDNIDNVLTLKSMGLFALVKVTGIGAMIGAGRISDEIWGS